MTTTIDKAGRVVIPAAMRQRLGLLPGTPIEVEMDDTSIRLTSAVPGPKLVRRSGWLVARPTVPQSQVPKVDVAKLIREERDRWPY